jgi:hypothetical protein
VGNGCDESVRGCIKTAKYGEMVQFVECNRIVTKCTRNGGYIHGRKEGRTIARTYAAT